MKWAVNRRSEEERSMRGDPMDCNPLDEDWTSWDENRRTLEAEIAICSGAAVIKIQKYEL